MIGCCSWWRRKESTGLSTTDSLGHPHSWGSWGSSFPISHYSSSLCAIQGTAVVWKNPSLGCKSIWLLEFFNLTCLALFNILKHYGISCDRYAQNRCVDQNVKELQNCVAAPYFKVSFNIYFIQGKRTDTVFRPKSREGKSSCQISSHLYRSGKERLWKAGWLSAGSPILHTSW